MAALLDLNEIILQACHPAVAERYQTAADLSAALQALQKQLSISSEGNAINNLEKVGTSRCDVLVQRFNGLRVGLKFPQTYG